MKSLSKYIAIVFLLSLVACSDNSKETDSGNHDGTLTEEEHHKGAVHLSPEQVELLGIKIDTLPRRNMTSYVKANGELRVPPQNEATVTAIVGANVVSIKVIEGEIVKKGQVLAYLAHPSLIQLQSDYLNAFHQMNYLEKEYSRQKRLYDEKVGSGKSFQETEQEYFANQARVKSLEIQLSQLHINAKKVAEGELVRQIPVLSPIPGSITLVDIKTGQFVQPQTSMFEIINTDHVHADLMVYEKDVHKVKVGQKVRFTTSMVEQELHAEIFSVGKKFEEDPKAVHIHADIVEKPELLIQGMYIKGEILTSEELTTALPEDAITRVGDAFTAFTAVREVNNGKEEWMFTPVEVLVGETHDGWIGIKPLKTLPNNTLFALGSAYYLIAEMKKGEAGHHH
ncbi:efflux RND transporter periplasmic adaptor subunit [Flammeovirgaceae bacterium SG7u.111]|nr:efflux RND transporter periplasmic adaptor subunit [Flammeovirgaceae bacterium SG7u.132]WPO38526.1 efflux RND transporter periplasmic adaptor subunit [Flammeovirgaceae bacterium SG7u.111]